VRKKNQFWNGNGCGETLASPPPACVLGIGDFTYSVRQKLTIRQKLTKNKCFLSNQKIV
jgi:hypothetical protein